MLVTKRNPDLFPTLFNDLFNMNFQTTMPNSPQMNIIENDESFKLELNVPGLTKEDLTIMLDKDNDLVIEMVKKNKHEEKDKNQHYLRREFSSTQFKETLALPDNIHTDQISAKVENGILEVVLPKIKPEEKQQIAQTIEIQ